MNDWEGKDGHQKRIFAHRPGWSRMLRRRFFSMPLQSNHYQGLCALTVMDRVSAPLVKTIHGRPVTIVGEGFTWLQYFLSGQDFSPIATFDREGGLVQWYVDVLSAAGVNEIGWPWYDDLYLDVISMPDGWTEIIDGEDLDQALENGIINQQLHAQAWQTARRLADEFQTDTFLLSEQAAEDRARLSSLAPRLEGQW